MKEFKNAMIYVLLSQGLCWLIFYLFDDQKYVFNADISNSASIIGIICLIVLLILYFVFTNKIVTKNKLNIKKFNIFLFLIWIFIQIPVAFILDIILDAIRPCESFGCIFIGFEYFIQWFLMLLFPILIFIINLIIKLCKHIKKNKK
jgi:hypothetical protein